MFKLTIVTPERKLMVDLAVEEVTIPGFAGELNVLPGHAPLITILQTGIMKWRIPGQDRQHIAVVSGGYCQVGPEGVNVLANALDLPEEIDVTKATAKLSVDEKKLLNDTLDDVDWEETQMEVARARADIEAAQVPKF